MRVGETRHPERSHWGKPLTGVRVLSVEQMQALPYATQLMTHLGAEVTKIEHPERGDSARASQPSLKDADGRPVGATYLRNNLSKKSVALDLKHEEGREVFQRLVPHFDVVGENFKPGTMERMGLGYAALAELHPGLVYVSVSGFGHAGDSPYASWPAYAPVGEAMGGLYEPNRVGDEPPPVVVAGALGDNASGLFAVIGVLSALRHRERTGAGQHVDISLYDSMVAMADMVPFLWSIGQPPEHATARAQGLVGAFRADDGHFVVAVFREHQFEALAETVGHPEWLRDPRLSSRAGWAQHRETLLREGLEGWARGKDKLACARALCERGVPAGPSNTGADLQADPHVERRDMLLQVPRPDGEGEMLVVGNPVKLSRVAEGPVGPSPLLGEHTREVLQGTLGLGEEELAGLAERGAIGRTRQ